MQHYYVTYCITTMMYTTISLYLLGKGIGAVALENP